MESSSQVSQSPFSGVPESRDSMIEDPQKYTSRFRNLPNTPLLHLDTVNQLLKYDPLLSSPKNKSAQFCFIPTDEIEMELRVSTIGEPRRGYIDSVVTPNNRAKLEQFDVTLYHIKFTPGGTPQEFIVVREGDDNFSFSVNLGSDGIAYMVPSTSNKDVVMNTQVAITDSFIMNIEEVPPE